MFHPRAQRFSGEVSELQVPTEVSPTTLGEEDDQVWRCFAVYCAVYWDIGGGPPPKCNVSFICSEFML